MHSEPALLTISERLTSITPSNQAMMQFAGCSYETDIYESVCTLVFDRCPNKQNTSSHNRC